MNKNIIVVFISGILILITTGCQSLKAYPDRTATEQSELNYIKHYFTDDVIKKYNEMDDNNKRTYRDEVINSRLRAVDLQFEIFEKAINFEHNLAQIGSDWAVLALSGAGAVTGEASTKAILAAISGGLTGAKLSVDKTLYYEKTMPVIIAQMEAMRATQLVNIQIGLQQGITQYPLSKALFDVDTYYKVGTLPGAIIGINNSAGAKAETAIKKLGEIQEGSYIKDKAGDLLKKSWKPDGENINLENQTKLKEWMKTNKLDPEAIIFFLRTPEFGELRIRAVKELGIDK